MDLHVTLSGRSDLAAQLYQQLRSAILEDRVSAGERVPSTRELAAELGISRGTASAAYDRLFAEGFLETKRGAGTFVASATHTVRRVGTPRPGGRPARGGAVRPTAVWERASGPVATGPSPPGPDRADSDPGPAAYDLGVGLPDPSLFPLAVWRRLVAHELRAGRLGQSVGAAYTRPAHPGLQVQIARYLGRARSVAATPDAVLVTTGAQQALDLVARVTLEPGAVVAVEDPGYTAAGRLFETHRARVVGVPVDREGLVVDALPTGARLVYVTPSHQFPLGVTLSLPRRIALLEWASRHDAVIVEDDYDSEFRFADRPLEPLQSLDREGRVVYVGTFSKTLLPGLRVGYAIAPPSLQPALREAKQVTDWSGDVVTQAALAAFLAEGHVAAHVRKATRSYAERRSLLLDGLAHELGDVLEVVPSVAGLHVTTTFRDAGVDDVAATRAARRLGVLVEPLSPRYRRAARPGLAIGFGGLTRGDVGPAVAALSRALRS